MDKKAEIKRRLLETVGITPNLPMTGQVVELGQKTCSVRLASGLVVTDVRLCSTDDEQPDGLVIYPQIESDVLLISQTGSLSSLVVIKVSQVSRIVYKVQDLEVALDGQTKKATIRNATGNVGALVDAMLQALMAASIETPAGPGTMSAATIAQLQVIKEQFNTILSM